MDNPWLFFLLAFLVINLITPGEKKHKKDCNHYCGCDKE